MNSFWLSSVGGAFSRRRQAAMARRQRRSRGLHRAEPLEPRRVMAFDFVSAFPNAGSFIRPNDVLNEAPQQITLRFSPGAKVDPATLGAITIVRAGGDNAFGNASDVAITPQNGVGIVTVDDFPNQNQVVLRFAENLPDDLYRITIGGGLKTVAGGQGAAAESFRNGSSYSFNFRLDLGAQVVSVVPQPISRGIGGALQHARDTIEVYFNANDPLDPTSAQSPRNYRLVETDPATGVDLAVQIPTAVAYDPVSGKATLTFAADLGDKIYRLQVGGSDDDNGTIAKAVGVGTIFQQVDPATPAYVTNSFLGDGAAGVNDVDLYELSLPAVTPGATLTVRVTPVAGSGFTPALRLFRHDGTAITAGVNVSAPSYHQLTYTAPTTGGKFFLGLSSTGNLAYNADGTGAAGGTTRGGYRLEIFSNAGVPGSDDNSSFRTATGLGTLGLAGQSFNAAINVRPTIPTPVAPLQFPSAPGTIDEPGHREIPLPVETHELPAASLDEAAAADVKSYCFPRIYGVDGQGNALINAITENQKQRAREVFELYSRATGIRFVETVSSGLAVVTGDLRALDPSLPVPNGPAGVGGSTMAIMNGSLDYGQSEYGGFWHRVAFHEIGHSLGLGHSYDIPSVMGADKPTVLPGDHDLVHLSVKYPAHGTDIDVYSFQLDGNGTLAAETVVARPGEAVSSLLDSVLTLYREDATGRRELVARNDDSFGRDSFVGLELPAADGSDRKYTYYLAVTSTGNTAFDPEVENSGANGRSDGAYRLRLSFTPAGEASNTIVDKTGTPLDGDRDGLAAGAFHFWFRSSTESNTVYVDKSAAAAGADGSLAKPFTTVSAGLTAAAPGSGKSIVRIVGNAAATPYLVGTNLLNQPLADGTSFVVPRGVTVMIDAGAVFKFRSQVIDVGSSSPIVSRAGAALQVLGTPGSRVQFTSYHDDSIGGNSDGVGPAVSGGQWGGIIFRQDSDSASRRVFLNSVSNAILRYGGGQVSIDGKLQSIASLHLESTRPTLAFNDVLDGAGAAISADPNSFEESNGRAGPSLRGNVVRGNSVNGLLVRIRTAFGQPIDRLSVPARFSSPDITYVIPENLLIAGGVGGYQTYVQKTGNLSLNSPWITGLESVADLQVNMRVSGSGLPSSALIKSIDATNNRVELTAPAGQSSSGVTLSFEGTQGLARASGRLTVDPGVVVKLQGSRIELERGNAQLYAEGTPQKRVIFTSTQDNRFGAGGTFVAVGSMANAPAAGDWGGIVVNDAATASLDNAAISFGGGQTGVGGGFAATNTLSVDQGTLRLANSRFENNANGIYVIGAQPVIVGNDFRGNAGDLISIDANSLNSRQVPDPGRMTGASGRFEQYDDNRGPLIRGNTVTAGGVSGLVVRGDQITVESVWDDTDIVHVLRDDIVVSNFHTATGLRLMSSPKASLVVKLLGSAAGFTATGYGLDIDDRIGGTVQVIGQPGYPVILTSLADDSIGASVDPIGATVTDTNGDGTASRPQAGEWRGLRFLPYSNDRNVAVVRETEPAATGGVDVNAEPGAAQFLGVLAPSEVGGDDNRRLGFEVHGAISLDAPSDLDVYSFSGYAGSEVWIDIDNTSPALDAMVEVLDSSGNVIARSADAQTDHGPLPGVDGTWAGLSGPTLGSGLPLMASEALGYDLASSNPRDPGMRVVLPGVASITPGQYYIRVRSQPKSAANVSRAEYEAGLVDPGRVATGATSGLYELRVRLRQIDEKPGSTVRYADIRYPAVGIDVQGLPQHSPLTGTIGEGSIAGVNFSSFDNPNGLNLVGAATTDSGVLVLTPSVTGTAGAAWFNTKVNVASGFETRFKFRINQVVNNGGDGLAFVIQDDSATALGGFGGGMGYSGITKSLAVEFDTYRNTVLQNGWPSDEVSANHISIQSRGTAPNSGFREHSLASVSPTQTIGDGAVHDVIIRYSGSTLSVFFDNTVQPVLSVPVNLSTFLGLSSGMAYVGLTAGTGSDWERHNILDWSFSASQPTSIANDTFANAQYVGNLLASDLNTISIAGSLSGAADVDWYAIDLNYEQIQAIAGVNNGLKTWSTVFDIDYADGFRGDLTLSVFDSMGRLMYVGRDSNVADDQPGAGQTNFEDVARGSAGKLDPFIGPVHLPTGLPGSSPGEGGYTPPPGPNALPNQTTRYYVAVSSNELLPKVLDMTFKAGATNTAIRLEPVNSITRVIEDRIGLQGYHSGELVTGTDNGASYDARDYTYVAPSNTVGLFPLTNLKNQVTAFTLNDVGYYLSGTGKATGAVAAVDDLAMRTDGRLYTYAGVGGAANTAGTLSWINIRTNATTTVGRDNIPDFPAAVLPTEVTDAAADLTTKAAVTLTTQFQLDAHPAAISKVNVATITGGVLQYTGTLPGGLPGTGLWNFTSDATGVLTFSVPAGVTIPAGLPAPVSGANNSFVNDAGVVTVTWSGPVTLATVPFATPGMTNVTYTYVPNPPPPNALTTDAVDALAWKGSSELYYSVRDVDIATRTPTGKSRLYRGNPGSGDASAEANYIGVIDGFPGIGLTTGMAFIPTGNLSGLYGVDNVGHLFTIDPATAAATLIGTVSGVPNTSLQGLAIGPQNATKLDGTSPGYFADRLFAISADGDLMCLNPATAAVEAVFPGNAKSQFLGTIDPVTLAETREGGYTGFAFSPLDVPLWRGTNNRGADPGHGVTISLDRTRDAGYDNDSKTPVQSKGNTSIYYGLDGSGGTAPDATALSHVHVVSKTWLADLTAGLGSSIADLPFKGSRPVTVSSSTFANARYVKVASTRDLTVGMEVSGPGISRATTIISIDSPTRITLSAPATDSGDLVALTFVKGVGIKTQPFSLEDRSYTDKPTLYFNYRIEAGAGSTRVQIRADGVRDGAWITIAANEHIRSPLDTDDNTLPAFPSVSAKIGAQPNQLVQELFEGGWRQARIDIGEYAGSDSVELRFAFTPGPGAEGVYLDDFIVGFAERGEMVTGWDRNSPGNTDFFDIGTPSSATTAQQNLSGAYQLEIRRGMEYGELTGDRSGAVQILGNPFQIDEPVNVVDSNDRLVRGKLHSGQGYGGVTQDQNLRGDENTPRGQGQFIIEGNVIAHADQYGIRIDAAARNAATGASPTGVVKNTPVLNTSRLVPGVVVTNNVIASTHGEAAILFSGDPIAEQAAPVPYGRIVNNTIHGGVPVTLAATTTVNSTQVTLPATGELWSGMAVTGAGIPADTRILSINSATGVTLTRAATAAGSGVPLTFAFRTAGVQVTDNAAPTLLNNVFASLATGISVDATSAGTVVEFSAFYDTKAVGVPGKGAVTLTDAPFVNAARGNFYPVSKAPIIDRALDVLQDRDAYVAVTQPLGIPVSPIIAPSRDLFGQLRSDDATQASPLGLGSDVFKDLGAIDRVDFVQPWLTLAEPLDQGLTDGDPTLNSVSLSGSAATGMAKFILQLNDAGVGIDKTTVVKQAFTIVRDGTTLAEGTDYVFRYLESTNRVVFESPSAFSLGEYEIRATTRPATSAQDGYLTDLANNTLLNNNPDGSTTFTVSLIGLPAPTNLVATGGAGSVGLTWTAPDAPVDAPISDYVVQYRTDVVGSSWQTFNDGLGTTAATTVTPLTNGTTYRFRVAAVNNVGTGKYSDEVTATPRAVPAFPTGLTGVAGNAQVVLNWTAPVDNGGAAITGYVVEYSTDGGSSWPGSVNAASTTATVTGLTNGTQYWFRVSAVNSVGTGAASGQAGPYTPAMPASAPTGLTATFGNGSVGLLWTAPSSNGGAAITDYRVEYKTGAGSWTVFADGTSTNTSASVTGLTNGVEYMFRVAAINSVGVGAYSTEVTETPRAVPSMPTGLAGVVGNAQVALSWSVPAANGAAITDYVVEYKATSDATWSTFADGASPTASATVTGLINGTSYQFRVSAVNTVGTGAASATAGPLTPRTVPNAPTAVSGTPQNGAVALTWTAGFDGGAAITGYVLQYRTNEAGSAWTPSTPISVAATPTTATVTGLTNGTAYLFRVSAVNAAGTGAAVESAAVTPRTVAGQVSDVVATGSNGRIEVTWNPPASNGGAAITGYLVAFSTSPTGPFSAPQSVSTTSAAIAGLTNGVSYYVRVRAVNAAGNSAPTQVGPVVPFVQAAAPTGLTGTAGSGRVNLSWTAGTSPKPITGYVVEFRRDIAGSSWTRVNTGSAATTATVTSLTNGIRYLFRVAAVNADGVGVFTNGTLGLTPLGLPAAAPSAVTGRGSAGAITLNWVAAPSSVQAPVTGYVIQYRANSSTARWTTLPLTVGNVTTARITTLTSRLGYTFRVAARNAAGQGPWSAASALIRPF